MRNKPPNTNESETMSHDEKYQAFARELWRKGTKATDSGTIRTFTARQLKNSQDKFGMTTFDTYNPVWDARFKVCKTETFAQNYVMDTEAI